MDSHSPTHPPLVSVVLCTQARGEDLACTLQSLQGVEVPDDLRAELVVMENGPRGGAEAAVHAFRHERMSARHVHEETPGKSRALNRALREAGGEIFLFCDDDVRFRPDWLRKMCAPILAGQADAVAGWVRLAPYMLRPWMDKTQRAWLASTADYLSPEHPSEMCGANMAFHRRILDKVPGYDPELGPGLGGGEETLLSWQIREAGFRIVAAPEAELEHCPSVKRLRYAHWVKVAWVNGWARAYLTHHWKQARFPFPRLTACYLAAKLFLRRRLTRRPGPEDEGIARWEMDYLWELSTRLHFLKECRLPRKYAKRGLVKLDAFLPTHP